MLIGPTYCQLTQSPTFYGYEQPIPYTLGSTQNASWSALVVDPLPMSQQSQPQYVKDGAPIEEVGPFSEDNKEINLNNDSEDYIDEDENQNLNMELPSAIEHAYSMPAHMRDMSSNNPSKDHQFDYFMDCPEEPSMNQECSFKECSFLAKLMSNI